MNVVCFNAEKFYRLANDYFQYESDIKNAKKYVDIALENDPNHFKSLLLRGQIFLFEKNPKNALETFLSALDICPDNVYCMYNIANTYNILKKYKLSLRFLDKILVQNLSDKEFLSECYKLKINILINLNQYKKAENILKTLNYRLFSNDIFNLEENFYKTVKNKKSLENGVQKRILHVNF